MRYQAGQYDIVVIGAGHAGIEAALAAARLGASVAVFAINLDSVGNLPCNPSIGGTAKGHLVCEIDALGGEMGKAADATTLQSRMLNRGKGPAVHSLRAQIDRRAYAGYMKSALERTPGIHLRQAEIIAIEKTPGGWLAITNLGACYGAKCVIIATGTFLGGRIHIGEVSYDSGPDGMFPASALAGSLKTLGIPLRRFKTGTPARIHRDSIDFEKLERQEGDPRTVPFSLCSGTPPQNLLDCYITYTNEKTKEIILQNLHRSPMYSGKIEGAGPRYCPSIEDKIVRFADKLRHQLFIEPCGQDTREMYLQGASSSLPEEVQLELYRSVPGLENCVIMRSAYAIEYDCADPTELSPTLEFIAHRGLFGAGQFNGSSGYEEAAAQGLVAGINAAHRVKNLPDVILERSGSYIGTLIDDLVTKGCGEPYRMMTSRSEYRLILRQDNAPQRLCNIGREIGLLDDRRWEKHQRRQTQKTAELKRARSVIFPPGERLNAILEQAGTSKIVTGARLSELLKRPQISYDTLSEIDLTRPDLEDRVFEQTEIELKYEGYINRQLAQVREAKRLEQQLLPENIDYAGISGLRIEAREKLAKIRPVSVGQAGRISGVSPADVGVLIVWLANRSSKSTS